MTAPQRTPEYRDAVNINIQADLTTPPNDVAAGLTDIGYSNTFVSGLVHTPQTDPRRAPNRPNMNRFVKRAGDLWRRVRRIFVMQRVQKADRKRGEKNVGGMKK